MQESSHRLQDGSYAPCGAPEGCQRPFHLPMIPAEAEATPLALLLPIFEIMDPPHETAFDGSKIWVSIGLGQHREYDLPAAISPAGDYTWYTDGLEHRDGDKPSYIGADGFRRWMQRGAYARADGAPIIVDASGEPGYLTLKQQHKRARQQRRWLRRSDYYKRLKLVKKLTAPVV